MIRDFEDIVSWQKAQDLTFEVYTLFKDIRDYSFRDQIQRAWISISNNIAEGFERRTNKEFRYFLYVAKWSCWEFRSMLLFAKRIWYIQGEEFKRMYTTSIDISKLVFGLIKKLRD